MSANHDVEVGRRYHEETKHSEWSVRSSRHFLDWENQPLPFKVYRQLEPIPLVRSFAEGEASALDAIGRDPARASAREERIPDLAAFLVYFDELMPMVDEAERRHSEALTALRGLKDLRHRAAAVLGAEGASGGGALSMGYDQQPQITIERRESAHR